MAKKKDKQKDKLIKTFAIALVIFIVLGTGISIGLNKFNSWNPFNTEGDLEDLSSSEEMMDVLVSSDSPYYDMFMNSSRVNFILLGINPPLSDTIMFVSFDKENKHVDLISIPRDTYYHRDGYSGLAEDKLNAAYKENAINTAKAVSEILLGVPINYYAVIDYDGVKNIVDAMGGVPINITHKGGLHYEDPYDKPPLVIDIPEGQQVLDGEHAVQFLRYRKGYAEGDLGRVKAQQEFMRNAFKQCISFDILDIAQTVFENVDSDITMGVVTSLAKSAVGIGGDDIETYTLPVQIQDYAPYYVYPKSQEIGELLTQIYTQFDVQETEGGEVAETETEE